MVGAIATEMQNNFGRYLTIVADGKEVIITKNGKEVARLIPRNAAVSFSDRFPVRYSERWR